MKRTHMKLIVAMAVVILLIGGFKVYLKLTPPVELGGSTPEVTPIYVPTLIRELSTFFILQSGRRSVAEPGGLQLAA